MIELFPERSNSFLRVRERRVYAVVSGCRSEFAERFGDVAVENPDCADLFAKYDSEDTVFYCEPPYVGYEDYTPKSRGEQTTDRYDLLREGRARGPCRLLEAVRQCPVLTKSLMLMCTMLTT
jgi:hypothetical protein